MTTQQLKAIITATLMQGAMPYLIEKQKEGADEMVETVAGAALMADEIIEQIYANNTKMMD
ncbi:MAG: hypothetical protein JST88_09195 [Bacteroidetes bacterium]|nr:hypothetical protein [Bacteroidota bacterium]